MKTWQVQASGEEFVRGGVKDSFELCGFVQAEGPDEAFQKALIIAKRMHPEIAHIDKQGWPKPVINADEIEDATGLRGIKIDIVEIYWDNDEIS